MSNEELMRPRYKVIALYPGCFWKVGDIFKYDNYNCFRTESQPSIPLHGSVFTEHPHLFKKLEWWEDLTPEQVPKYIKSKDRKEVREVIELTPEGFKAKYPERPKGYRICYNNRWLPATATEYEQYINQKEKQ